MEYIGEIWSIIFLVSKKEKHLYLYLWPVLIHDRRYWHSGAVLVNHPVWWDDARLGPDITGELHYLVSHRSRSVVTPDHGGVCTLRKVILVKL